MNTGDFPRFVGGNDQPLNSDLAAEEATRKVTQLAAAMSGSGSSLDSTGLSASTGWQFSSGGYTILPVGIGRIQATFRRTGANLDSNSNTGAASGIVNLAVCSFATPAQGGAASGFGWWINNTSNVGGMLSIAGGVARLRTIEWGGAIAQNSSIIVTGFFFV